MQAFNFGIALLTLKDGGKCYREAWQNKGWVQLFKPELGSQIKSPFLVIKNVYGDLVPWVASHTDLLSEDWLLVKD